MKLFKLVCSAALAAALFLPTRVHAGGDQFCGNGIQEGDEQCDDGSSGSFCCSPSCEINPECGCCEDDSPRSRHAIGCFIGHPENCSFGTFYPNATCTQGGCSPKSVCGNEVLEPGEQCDDGGTQDGDCCDSECQIEKPGSPCFDDKNICTADVCDGKGLCNHVPADPLPESCGCCEQSISARVAFGYCSVTVASGCAGQFFANAACTEGGCEGTVCGNGVIEAGEDCDPGGTGAVDCCDEVTCKFESAGTACSDDSNECTTDQCNAIGECNHTNNTNPCDDGQFCTENDTCGGGYCVPGAPKDCAGGNTCSTGTCNEDLDQCQVVPNPDLNGQACDDNNACTQGTTCSGGACAGGSSVTCDDSSTCTQDSCDMQLGCVYDTVVESAACGSCEDGEDNDGDGDSDAEDCGCSSLCAQQRFAVVTTFVPTKFTRYAFYSGSDVTVGDAPFMTPFPTGGVCITNGTYRAGNNLGHIATTGSSEFGKGATLDPDLLDEEGENEFDTDSNRVTIIRQRFDSDGDPEKNKSIAPFVGPGVCSHDAMLVCTGNAQCGGAPNTCQGQLRLDNPMNSNVSRNGSAENFGRCIEAQATVDGEAATIEAIPGNVAGLSDGTGQLKTSANIPVVTVNVGAGQQVIYVNRVLITGKTKLRFVRTAAPGDPPTVLVVRVRRQLRLGGQAEIELDGINPENVIWSAEGTAGGRPKLLRSSIFRGTLLAAERRGVLVGGLVQVHGAVKARRVHLGQGTTITHTPFKPLLVP